MINIFLATLAVDLTLIFLFPIFLWEESEGECPIFHGINRFRDFQTRPLLLTVLLVTF